MFTEHGFVALVKFILILMLAAGLDMVCHHFFGWENVSEYITGGFLLTYIVNYEKLEAQRKVIRERIRGL